MKTKFLILLFFSSMIMFSQTITASSYLMLFGGEDHKEFLGYINANMYVSESIWNAYGTYGSEYSSKSIWNEYGNFGSEYSSYSPWNEYASNPPIIVDSNGNFYGYFTVNKFHNKRTQIKFCLWILGSYDYIKENFNDVANEIN